MAHLATLPRRSRLERVSIALAGAVALIGAAGLWNNGLFLDRLPNGNAVSMPVYPEESLCFVLLGLALFARDWKWRSVEWLAVLPGALGLVRIWEALSNREFRLDSFLSVAPGDTGNHYLRFASMTAVCLVMSGFAVAWHAATPKSGARRFAEAAAGSILAAIGCATLFGYLANLIDVSKWGTSTPIPPATALALLLLGFALLAQGWQESMKLMGEPPSWAPLPIAAWGLSLTLILWADLRHHALDNLSTQTQTQMQAIAIDTNSMVEHQISLVERIAQGWKDPEYENYDLWKSEALHSRQDMLDSGCVSLAYVGTEMRTLKFYPVNETEQEDMLGFNHASESARREAMAQALAEGRSVSGSIEIPDSKGRVDLGYAIYVSVRDSSGKPAGFAVEEFSYRRLFEIIGAKVQNYRFSITVPGTRIYTQVYGTADPPEDGNALTTENNYVVQAFNRLVHLKFEPSNEAIGRDRPLQESVLVAGIVLSGLMGLAVQQALRARSGQRIAERTNLRLRSEIDERRRMEIQLKHAKYEAESGSRAKSEFLASMSHEIRTPMNGVIGMASLLMDTKLTPEQRDYVNTIRASGDALLTIINEILDFSKIESGKMEIEHHPFELAPCVEETLDLFGMQAAAKRLELGCFVSPDIPAWVVGDVTRLRQVIANLVNNAIKFTPSGSVSVEVKRGTMPPPPPKPEIVQREKHLVGEEDKGEDDDESGEEDFTPAPKYSPLDPATNPNLFALEIAVRDTGIGIPPDRMDRLFKAFSQVDSSTTRKYGGTGLGLAICQRLCQLMGGGIRVESAATKGSAFIFTVLTEPAPEAAPEAPAPIPVPLRGHTAICVEDLPVNQARLRVLFEGWGCHCVVVPDAKGALAAASALGEPPALLVVDDDGNSIPPPWQVLESLGCPRLVMFPFGQTAPAAPPTGPAFDAISKPIKNGLLKNAVTGLYGPRRADSGTKADAGDSRLLAEEFPIEVLLAEDNAVNQKVALRFLERLGYRADVANNGREALNMVELRHYDLVLMDMQMPDMDGLESSRQIRRRLPRDQQPVIVALTANAMKGDREICLSAGMDDHVSKPVKMDEIASAIRRHFGKKAAAGRSTARRG